MSYQENGRYPTEEELKDGAKSLAEKWRKDEESKATAPPIQQQQCFYCKHIYPRGRCEAFPKGIPYDIMFKDYDHTNPYPGDNGIRFEKGQSPWVGKNRKPVPNT